MKKQSICEDGKHSWEYSNEKKERKCSKCGAWYNSLQDAKLRHIFQDVQELACDLIWYSRARSMNDIENVLGRQAKKIHEKITRLNDIGGSV